MSIDQIGINDTVEKDIVSISISENHPLIKLANSINWNEVEEAVLPDLQSSTEKSQWWRGRPLRLRIHLGAYFLQQLFDLTDRQTEYGIRDNAALSVLFLCHGYLQGSFLRTLGAVKNILKVQI